MSVELAAAQLRRLSWLPGVVSEKRLLRGNPNVDVVLQSVFASTN